MATLPGRDGTELKEPNCENHKTETLSCFCKECDLLVCNNCVFEHHKTHDWWRVSDVIGSKRYELFNNLSFIHRKMRSKVSKAKKASNDLNEDMVKIDIQADRLIAFVNEAREELKQELEDRDEQAKSSIQRAETERELFEKVRKICIEKLKYGSDAEVITANKNIKLRVDEIRTETSKQKLSISSFEQGNIEQDSLRSMLGTLVEKSEYRPVPNFPAQNTLQLESCSLRDTEDAIPIVLKSAFKYGAHDVESICPMGSKAWIHQRECRTNALINIDGDIIRKLNFRFTANSIVRNRDGILFCADFKDRCVYKVIASENKITKLFETNGLRPTSIYLTRDNNLLLGLVDDIDYTPRVHCTRKIVKVCFDGNEVRSYDSDQMFTIPRKVIETPIREICVIDVLGENKGRVCVLDPKGKLKFVYKEYRPKAPLWDRWTMDIGAWDVSCDRRCRLVVSSYRSKDIRFIDADGKLLQKIAATDFGVDRLPQCMAVDDFNLWVGFKEGYVMVLKYDD